MVDIKKRLENPNLIGPEAPEAIDQPRYRAELDAERIEDLQSRVGDTRRTAEKGKLHPTIDSGGGQPSAITAGQQEAIRESPEYTIDGLEGKTPQQRLQLLMDSQISPEQAATFLNTVNQAVEQHQANNPEVL